MTVPGGARVRLLVLAAALFSMTGCGGQPKAPNLLVVTLDTTRGDRFGFSGHEGAHTPSFDRFVEERAAHFSAATTVVPLTLPSHTSIMTGTYPAFHGVHDNEGYYVDPEVSTLAEILQTRGYSTAAVLAAFPLDSQFNLDQGFDIYNDEFQEDWSAAERRSRGPRSFGFVERTADRVNMTVERWLQVGPREPFFLWVHYFDAHANYEPPKTHLELAGSNPYDGEISFVDEQFGRLLRALDRSDVLDRTVVIVVGDHGESLGEHGESTHSVYIYDSTMGVPLLVATPDRRWAGRAVTVPVSVVDVAPTALELLGLPAGEEMQGRSLVPLLDNHAAAEAVPVLLETWKPHQQFGWAPLRALREGRWKLIQAPRTELYDLEADPEELVNLAQQRPEVVQRMERTIEELAQTVVSPDPSRSAAGPVSDATRARLEALGYVSHGGAAPAREFPSRDELLTMVNPRDRVEVVRLFNAVVQHLRLEHPENAVDAARRALEYDPDNGTMNRLLGDGLYRLGQHEQALQAYREACRLRPRAAKPRIGAAAVHHQLGNIEDEIEELLIAHSLDPTSARTLLFLAAAHVSIGRDAEAIGFLEQAVALDSENWLVHRQLGRGFARLGLVAEAKEAFSMSLTLNPGAPSTRRSYGLLLRKSGDLEAAREMLQSAVNIAPDTPMTHLELAEVLIQLGNIEEAKYHVEWVLELAPESELAQRARRLLADGS